LEAFIYCAALLCGDCGEDVRKDITDAGHAPADPDNESTYDSDQFPKGSYPDGGGEADGPQFCDHCGTFLENPLTDEGDRRLREMCEPYIAPDDDGDVAPWPMVADRAEDDGKPELADAIRYYFAPGM
jgi:hypothetical protein